MKKFLILFLALLYPALAIEPNKATQLQIQDYLNGITALVSDFVQTNPDGDKVRGKIWLKRTGAEGGKLRIDYEKRIPQRIIALKNNLYIYDLNTNETPEPQDLGNMPAAFILQNEINLTKDAVFETPVKSPDGQFLSIRLTDPAPLTLMFSLYPNGNIKGLAGWVLEDSHGLICVDLIDMQDNDPRLVPADLFKPPFKDIVVD
ncbi:MAG: outer membrane lipoprotein carrier protein LolA [Alphaproteobacteria bacterium]|jgi:outer membrane lipoprotein-sorting protein|nr:outer membrane lipoprotein carrier protein LolA [Alphaproteobacteria bacterium]